jgi:uncharacterized protein (DUF1684 family)
MTLQTRQEDKTGSGRTEGFAEEWEEWHRKTEVWRADPHGFLAITSLHWLTQTPERFSDAPGLWSTGDEGVIVQLDDSEEIFVDGNPVHGVHSFGIIPERGSVNAVWGDAVLEVAKRAGHHILRPRHPDNPLLLAYRGTAAYDPDPRWRVQGHFIPFDSPHPTTVDAAVEGLEHVYEAPGRIVFELGGDQLSLTAFPGYTPGGFFVLFTDKTSGITTYGPVRSLPIEAPESDGSVILDFNRTVNLPCAYTELATCPLPPVENRLPIAIEAGEKTPYEPVGQKKA